MHGQNARKRTGSSLHNPQIRINSTLPTSRGGNGSTRMRDFTIDDNHTISCRHWASSTFKFPTYRETSESTNKDSTLNLSSTLRKYRCRLYYRKGRWTGKSSKYLSNTTHFYRPTPKLNALTKIINPTFRINAKLLATRRPSL